MAERTKITTKRGIAHWPHLGRTSTFKGVDTGKYECGVILEGEALEDLKAKVDDFLVDVYGPKKAKTAKLPFRETKDGQVFVKFSTKAEINGKPNRVKVWDKMGTLVSHDQANQVGNGSLIAISGTMASMTQDVGVAFYLDSVQVFRLVKYTPGGADRPAAAEDADELGGDDFDAPAARALADAAASGDEDDGAAF